MNSAVLIAIFETIIESDEYNNAEHVRRLGDETLHILLQMEEQLGEALYVEIEDMLFEALSKQELMGFITGWKLPVLLN